MLTIITKNDYNKIEKWEYRSIDELKKEWLSDSIDMRVPSNDTIVLGVSIDNISVMTEIIFAEWDNICLEDYLIFEDICRYFGFEQGE